jgi:hypothetical protein
MKLSKRIAKYKIYLDRARTYVSYIQLLMIIKIFMTDVGIDSNYIMLLGVALCMIILLIIGMMDTKLGIRETEFENNSLHNPVFITIMKKLDEINNKQKTGL